MKESNTGYDKDSNSFVEINNDPVLQEQCRLICLGCYSGNLNIVLLLLKYVKKDALNISVSQGFSNNTIHTKLRTNLKILTLTLNC